MSEAGKRGHISPVISRRNFVAASLSAAAIPAGLLSGCKPASAKVFRAAELHPENYPTSQAILEMDRLLRVKTNGELSIKLYASGQLGAERDMLELAAFGGIDINRAALGPLNSIEPMTVIPSLPFVFDNVAHMRASMDGAPGRKVLDTLRPHGLVGLCFYDSGARSFYNTKRPIYAPEDMHGLKLRVQNSDLYVSMVQALGANPTPMPLGEVYQSLVQGVVDGAENNWPSYLDGRHFEVAKYYSLTRHAIAPEILVMSQLSWDRLGRPEKDAIIEAAKQSVPFMRAKWDEKVRSAEIEIRDAGAQINEVADKQAFAAKMGDVWKDYVTTPEQKRLVEDIRNLA